jgi:hypothetical protein
LKVGEFNPDRPSFMGRLINHDAPSPMFFILKKVKGRLMPSTALPQSRLDVGLAEVFASEEERFACCPGKGVGKAIPKVKACGMAASAVVGVALSCEESLLERAWLDLNLGLAKESLILTDDGITTARFKNN